MIRFTRVLSAGASIVIASTVALAGCKKKATTEQQPPPAVSDAATTPPVAIDAAPSVEPAPALDAAAAAAPSLPPELTAFDAALQPLLGEASEDARGKKACEQHEPLRLEALPIHRLATPAGVDAEVWTKATSDLEGALTDLAMNCAEGMDSGASDLDKVAGSYRALADLAGKAGAAK